MADKETNQVSDITISDVLIFGLSKRLGSRSEVLKTPLLEALFHYEWETMKEKENRIMHFLNVFHAHPYADSDKRSKHLEMLSPDFKQDEPLEMKTDLEYLKKLKEQQEKGGIIF